MKILPHAKRDDVASRNREDEARDRAVLRQELINAFKSAATRSDPLSAVKSRTIEASQIIANSMARPASRLNIALSRSRLDTLASSRPTALARPDIRHFALAIFFVSTSHGALNTVSLPPFWNVAM